MTKPCIHTHACARCGVATLCDGDLEPNHDGFPVVICRSFHLDGGQVDDTFRCDECEEKVKADNYDPPDPDGEEMFRDYAAELRDSMDAARKLK